MYYEISQKEKNLRLALRKVDRARKCLDAVRVLIQEGHDVYDRLESEVSRKHNDATMDLNAACMKFNSDDVCA
jgi:hypothetical protein